MTIIGHEIISLFNESLDSLRPRTKDRFISDRDANILKYRFDFENESFPDYKIIGDKFDLSQERVRQIIYRAFRILGGAGRKLQDDIPIVRMLRIILNLVDSEKTIDKNLNIIISCEEWFPGISPKLMIDFIARLVYYENKDVKNCMNQHSVYAKACLIDEKNKIKKQLDKKKCKEIVDQLFKQVVWFEKRSLWPNIEYSKLEAKRETSNDTLYINGDYKSHKCNRLVQYESGLELNFILLLEKASRVKYYIEQPLKINYTRNGANYSYTPDFAVFLENNEIFIVEIKDYTGMVDCRTQRRIEALIDYCKEKGFGLLLTDGKYTITKLLTKQYNTEFEAELNDRLSNGKTMLYNEFKEMQDRYNVKWIELLQVVVKNNWSLHPFPFGLRNTNGYGVFRENLILTARSTS